MKMNPVDSSSITHIGHNGDQLQVKYKNGTTYQFDGVSPDIHEKLMKSPSVGKHLHSLGLKGKKI